jgi:hypothetical protein
MKMLHPFKVPHKINVHLHLPLSFHDLWPYNRDVNPARVLRNANNRRILPNHFATFERSPIVPR